MKDKLIYATKCTMCGKTIVCSDYQNPKKLCDDCKKKLKEKKNER